MPSCLAWEEGAVTLQSPSLHTVSPTAELQAVRAMCPRPPAGLLRHRPASLDALRKQQNSPERGLAPHTDACEPSIL